MKVRRQIVFLCGPNYKEKDKGDRRNILLDFLEDTFDKKVIVLIIDDFVTPKNINDDSINIKLLEEIFASISSKTYIFLDTMSAASELGLFASHSASNKIHVLLPSPSDITDNKVGYFINNIILEQNGEQIERDYYRPQIIKKAIASGHLTEHFGFISNELPKEIADKIRIDSKLGCINRPISICKNVTDIPQEFAKFNITVNDDQLNVAISIKTLFYIIVKLVYKKYDKAELKNKLLDKMNENFIDDLEIKIKKSIALSISINKLFKLYDHKDVNIITNSQQKTKVLIKHILKFIFIYHENDPKGGKLFITDEDKIATIMKRDLKENPFEFFDLNENSVDIIYSIRENPDNYFKEFKIKKYKKTRELCKYKENKYGEDARKLHNSFLDCIKNKASLSDSSYAYQEGKSIVSCVKRHINSIGFIKLDIKKYFNSIDTDILVETLIEVLGIDCLFKNHIKTIIESCTYNNKLPLGFTVSPILTEIYMKSFDDCVAELARKHGYIYTRYADDIMISSDREINEESKDFIISDIEHTLSEKKLQLNKSKCGLFNLLKTGHHTKYLGTNIVKGTHGNFLSVGKKYKNKVAKEYLKYLELPSKTEEQKTTKFYKSRIISGKISFIKQVEGENGFNKVIERIKVSTEGRVDIKTDIIHF